MQKATIMTQSGPGIQQHSDRDSYAAIINNFISNTSGTIEVYKPVKRAAEGCGYMDSKPIKHISRRHFAMALGVMLVAIVVFVGTSLYWKLQPPRYLPVAILVSAFAVVAWIRFGPLFQTESTADLESGLVVLEGKHIYMDMIRRVELAKDKDGYRRLLRVYLWNEIRSGLVCRMQNEVRDIMAGHKRRVK